MARTAEHWWVMLTRGLASFALAGVLLVVPSWSSLATLAVAFGIWALVDGAASLAFVFRLRGIPVATYVGRGCLGIAVGGLALALARTSTMALYSVVAAWAIGTGTLEMAFASRRWFVLPKALGFMLVGAVSLAFGMSLLPFPLETAATLRAFLVAFAIVNGVAALVLGEKLHVPPGHNLPSRVS